MSKPWDHRAAGRRPSATRERRRVLIVCEDSKSSRFYFQSFPIDPARAEVLTLGEGMNTDSLVTEAMQRAKTAAHDGHPYNEVWCGLDRDDFPQENYCRAFQLAGEHGINMAWANEAFELWYLLHFNYHDTCISRHDYRTKLRQSGLEYDKADQDIYEKMKVQQAAALKFAHRLERYWNDTGTTWASDFPNANVLPPASTGWWNS